MGDDERRILYRMYTELAAVQPKQMGEVCDVTEQLIRDQQARIKLLEDWLYHVVDSLGGEISLLPLESRPEDSQVVLYSDDERVYLTASDTRAWELEDDDVCFIVGEPDAES
jgi:hypothetical protein